jgi:rfaE bifunctional protein nucleotidyltransferase chain/domain
MGDLQPRGNREACARVSFNNPKSKIVSLENAVVWRGVQRENQAKIVLTNGVFDLLHTGHLHFLNEARNLGDALVVALNGDSSVRALKGPLRPVQTEDQRAYALASLGCVDRVVIFHTERLDREIRELRPDIYSKAGDYLRDPLNPKNHKLNPLESGALNDVGAEICFVSFLPGFSTTNLIARIKAAGEV